MIRGFVDNGGYVYGAYGVYGMCLGHVIQGLFCESPKR
jgi:hypothetical protein